jgi:hypothetical protein
MADCTKLLRISSATRPAARPSTTNCSPTRTSRSAPACRACPAPVRGARQQQHPHAYSLPGSEASARDRSRSLDECLAALPTIRLQAYRDLSAILWKLPVTAYRQCCAKRRSTNSNYNTSAGRRGPSMGRWSDHAMGIL